MPLQSSLIAPYQAGLKKNKKPFLILDDAFQELENAYCFRETIKKRDGIQLVSRLRRTFTTESAGNVTIDAGTTTINLFTQLSISGEPNAALEPGDETTITLDFAAPLSQTWEDSTGTGVMTGNAGNITAISINYATGEVIVQNSGAPIGPSALTVSLSYYPSLPVMGMPVLETANINSEQSIVFDTKYAYSYGGGYFSELSSTTPTTWTGNDSDFFWGTNYRGSTANSRLFFVTNFSGTTGDTNRYYDNLTWNDLTPVISDLGGGAENTFYQSRILIPYYGRLVALSTYEGTTAGGLGSATNFFNRCRFSQIGNPLETEAWLHDEFGRGGFIDAPTNEAIVSARFYKSTLIVFFERSTWALQYVGEYGLPFTWERISSDFGSESTLSTVLFDDGVLAVGNRAIVASSSNDVQRIDLEVPDTVFDFHNEENGKLRVNGARDFQKEIVYWCYSDGGFARKFPNRVLLYNYRNNTWAVFRDNVTAFGQFTTPTGVSWDSPTEWDSDTEWDTEYQAEFPVIISGNQQGYVHFYQYSADFEDAADSDVDAIEAESLYISAITRSNSANLRLTVYDHNLETGDIIYITGMNFVETSSATVLDENLNNRFYYVIRVDDDTIDLSIYSFDVNSYTPTYEPYFIFSPVVGTGTYMGGGNITLFPKVNIITKDFNPYQAQAQKMFLSYIDFQTDATPNSSIAVNLILDAANSPDVYGNLLVGNEKSPTNLVQTGRITGATQANPCVITSPNHSLKTGNEITIRNVEGMTELNGNSYTVTFLSLNSFSINADSSLFTTYSQGGTWELTTEVYPYIPGSDYAWHRFYSNSFGQYVTVNLTYNDEQMNTLQTHQGTFELNAMQLWHRPGGRFI